MESRDQEALALALRALKARAEAASHAAWSAIFFLVAYIEFDQNGVTVWFWIAVALTVLNMLAWLVEALLAWSTGYMIRKGRTRW